MVSSPSHVCIQLLMIALENFKMHMTDLHCQHVIFGGSADNGYARLLEPYSKDSKYVKRITMLEGPPFANELINLVDNFATTSFESVFRKNKLNFRNAPFDNAPATSFHTTYTNLPVQGLSKVPNSMPYSKENRDREVRPATYLNYTNTLVQGQSKWSSPTTFLTEDSDRESRPEKFLRNSKGERVDPQLHLRCSQQDVMDIRPKKLCNNYHLLGHCSYGNACSHRHGPELKPNELDALRSIARLTPCGNGLRCKDESCVYGHKCQRRFCVITQCRFPPEMHNVDMK
jgi:hypothetical protein